jgi:hypothetical protein
VVKNASVIKSLRINEKRGCGKIDIRRKFGERLDG